MCFSNLPIEFDDEGNPYLAEEADEVGGLPDDECGCTQDVPLEDADPETMVDEILETVPSSVREGIADRTETRAGDSRERSAGGD